MTAGRGLRGVLFDLDGTLLDTAPDMAAALNRLRVAEGLEALPFAQIRPLVSHGAPRLLRLAFGEPEAERHESLRRRFLDFYRAALAVHTRLFDGFEAVLSAIERSGLRWGIVTNKPGWLAAPLVAEVGLAGAVPASSPAIRSPSASRTRCRCCMPRASWASSRGNACTWAMPNATCRPRGTRA